MSYKAQALAHDLADELKKRSTLTLVEGFDANGDPTIALGDGVAGHKNFFIRVKAIDWSLSKNVIGLTSEVFTPHVIQFATEKNYEATTDNVLDILGPTELLPVLGSILARGTKVEWYRSTNGTAPTVTTINDSTKLSATYEAHLYWTMKSGQ